MLRNVDWSSITDVSGGSGSPIKTIIFILHILLYKCVCGLLDPRRWYLGCPETSVSTSTLRNIPEERYISVICVSECAVLFLHTISTLLLRRGYRENVGLATRFSNIRRASQLIRVLGAWVAVHAALATYEGWKFNFGNTPLDWIQELLEWRSNAAGRMGPSPTYIHNGSGPSRNRHTQ